MLVEGNLEAVVVAFAANEGDDIIRSAVALNLQQQGGGVEGDSDGILRYGAHKRGRGGIGTPVDRVDGHPIALTNHGYGATVVTDGVVAYSDPKVGTVVCRTEIGGHGKVVVSNLPPDDVGGHHAVERGGIHLFEEVDNSRAALAEACQDERTPLVEVSEIVGKSLAPVGHGNGHAGGNKGVGGEGLQCTLTVVGGVVVEVAAKNLVYPHHLAVEQLPDAVVAGVGIVAGNTFNSIVARLGGDDIEDVDGGIALGDVPLGAVGIVGLCRNYLFSLCHTTVSTRNRPDNTAEAKGQSYRNNCGRVSSHHDRLLYSGCKNKQNPRIDTEKRDLAIFMTVINSCSEYFSYLCIL